MKTNTGIRGTQRSTDQLPYGVALFMGALLSCIIGTALSMMIQMGVFTYWKSLPTPPANAIHIIQTNADNIWVEAIDGQTYTVSLECSGGATSCFVWRISGGEIDELSLNRQMERGEKCASISLGDTPRLPTGFNEKECVSSIARGPFVAESGYVTYFALVEGGTVKYWQNGKELWGILNLPCFSTVLLPLLVAIIISIVYLAKNSRQRQKAG